ncbi:hypothetical protein NEOLEDRAFT_678031 [Neolentinus lepideus HHB14362 ss-1]|uniref:Uncharacterized protein n=1 Tax=Neolentinus lepideus HHB14362 ss-1 TaxID=1314782 RepID=A0A165Q8Y6_9AGAM|nr:hypothetical protein NEOLEDRAFT_678031 [Neolentinus lepideus HHB14362 ss-1]
MSFAEGLSEIDGFPRSARCRHLGNIDLAGNIQDQSISEQKGCWSLGQTSVPPSIRCFRQSRVRSSGLHLLILVQWRKLTSVNISSLERTDMTEPESDVCCERAPNDDGPIANGSVGGERYVGERHRPAQGRVTGEALCKSLTEFCRPQSLFRLL